MRRTRRIAPTHLAALIRLREAFFSDLCFFLNLRNRPVNHSYKYLDLLSEKQTDNKPRSLNSCTIYGN